MPRAEFQSRPTRTYLYGQERFPGLPASLQVRPPDSLTQFIAAVESTWTGLSKRAVGNFERSHVHSAFDERDGEKSVIAETGKFGGILKDANPATQRRDTRGSAELRFTIPREVREVWWTGTESNRRHMDFQSIALPSELPVRIFPDLASVGAAKPVEKFRIPLFLKQNQVDLLPQNPGSAGPYDHWSTTPCSTMSVGVQQRTIQSEENQESSLDYSTPPFFNTSRAITIRWISFVPSKMRLIRASR